MIGWMLCCNDTSLAMDFAVIFRWHLFAYNQPRFVLCDVLRDFNNFHVTSNSSIARPAKIVWADTA